jgi:hypothetical protein
MSPSIIPDHIGLAVNNIKEGVASFENLTGIQAHLHPSESSAPFQSASVRIGETCYLEILGPNPNHKGIHPLKSLLRAFKEPTLWFWYIRTDDFGELEKKIIGQGRQIDQKTNMEMDESRSDEFAPHIRGSIGPGFDPVYPNIIQYLAKPKLDVVGDMDLHPLQDFIVRVPASDMAKKKPKTFFEAIGVPTGVLQENSDDKYYLSLTLKTPKGPITWENETHSVSTWKALSTTIKDVLGFL